MTDAELDMLQAMLVQTDPSRIGYSGPKKYNRDGFAANAAITYLRATLKSVLQREAEAYVRHDAKVDALEAQLAERDAIGAVVMRELAADCVMQARMGEADNDLRSIIYCIEGLPISTHAEQLVHALTLPEIKAMVGAALALNGACDAMWNDHDRLEENPSRFGQEWQIKELHVKSISEVQQSFPKILASLAHMEGKE